MRICFTKTVAHTILWPSNKQEDDDKPLIHRGANPSNLHYDDRYGRV